MLVEKTSRLLTMQALLDSKKTHKKQKGDSTPAAPKSLLSLQSLQKTALYLMETRDLINQIELPTKLELQNIRKECKSRDTLNLQTKKIESLELQKTNKMREKTFFFLIQKKEGLSKKEHIHKKLLLLKAKSSKLAAQKRLKKNLLQYCKYASGNFFF